MASTGRSVASYGRTQLLPDEYTKSLRETTCVYMVPKNHLTESDAVEMVNQLRQMTRNLERRVPKPLGSTRRPKNFTSRNIFPFLDLPPELRNRIYQYSLRRRLVQRLRCFTTPALSRVCQQLRLETLPVFFHVNTFVAEVKTSFLGGTQYVERDHWSFKYLGLVSIAGDVNPLSWEYYARKALFSNIDIVLVDPRNAFDGSVRHESAVLSLRSASPNCVSTHVNMGNSRTKSDRARLNELLDLGRKAICFHTSLDGGEGLSFKDLQQVAEAFRLGAFGTEPAKGIQRTAQARARRKRPFWGRKLPKALKSIAAKPVTDAAQPVTTFSRRFKPWNITRTNLGPLSFSTPDSKAPNTLDQKFTATSMKVPEPSVEDEFDLADAESYFIDTRSTAEDPSREVSANSNAPSRTSSQYKRILEFKAAKRKDKPAKPLFEDDFDLPDAESYFMDTKAASEDEFDLSDVETYFPT